MTCSRTSRLFVVCLFFMVILAGAASAGSAIDLNKARQYFKEISQIIDRDNGQLWGVRVGGPLLFVDPATRAVAASQADAEGALVDSGGVFVGTLPPEINISNTTDNWNGVLWVMLMWPLPEDSLSRDILLAHESWHYVQDKLGLYGQRATNAQLEEMQGRLWILLEWRALDVALDSGPETARDAIEDALLFRAKRCALYPDAEEEEKAMELHEGLAEYSGMALACTAETDKTAHAHHMLSMTSGRTSLTRSFPYASGPAYCLLLDRSGKPWKAKLTDRPTYGALLAEAYGLNLPTVSDDELIRRAMKYGYDELLASETEREEQKQLRLKEMRARFVEGPVLILPLRKMNMSFDPGQVVPVDDKGSVYGNLRMTDVWGILETTKGGMIGATFQQTFVPAPEDPNARPLTGDGWSLELADGWKLSPADRPGDYVLVEE